MKIEGHVCKYYSGRIKDVTVGPGNKIYCRRCGNQLNDDEVDLETLQYIKRRSNR